MLEKKIDGESRYAIVELFGHQKIAGRISDEIVGGQSFVRVDVPQAGEVPAYTKLFGSGAIYAITFVSEEIATAMAQGLQKEPVSVYDLPPEFREALKHVRNLTDHTVPADAGLARVIEDEDDFDTDDDDSTY